MFKYCLILVLLFLCSCGNENLNNENLVEKKYSFIHPIDSLLENYTSINKEYKNIALFVDIKNDLRFTLSIVPFVNNNLDSLNKIYFSNHYFHNGYNVYIYSGVEKILQARENYSYLGDSIFTGEFRGGSLLYSNLDFNKGWLYENFADTAYIIEGSYYPYFELNRLPNNDSFFKIPKKN